MVSGVVVAFAGEKVPQGWELCDGRQLDRREPKYQALYEAIGTAHGGNGEPGFQLPDYRGMFLRGVDAGAGRDPDATTRRAPGDLNTGNQGGSVGTVQDDVLRSHGHVVLGFFCETPVGGAGHGAALVGSGSRAGELTAEFRSSSTGGRETRPKNAYVQFIIKL